MSPIDARGVRAKKASRAAIGAGAVIDPAAIELLQLGGALGGLAEWAGRYIAGSAHAAPGRSDDPVIIVWFCSPLPSVVTGIAFGPTLPSHSVGRR
jgi:hypothetical protein